MACLQWVLNAAAKLFVSSEALNLSASSRFSTIFISCGSRSGSISAVVFSRVLLTTRHGLHWVADIDGSRIFVRRL